MSRVNLRRWTCCAALLMGAAVVGSDRVESAESPGQIPVQQVGLFHRTSQIELSEPCHAYPVYAPLEVGDIPLAPWDRAGRVCRWDNRRLARHEEKKAWHYYIRGVGPAVHERSPGRPCWH